MDSLIIALQLLTRIPVSYRLTADDANLGQSVLYYPIVGFLIGVLLSILVLLLSAGPDMLAAALVLMAWIWLSGGLRLDEQTDFTHAWAGGLGCIQRSLKRLKVPNAGPITVLAILLVLLLKWSTILILIEKNELTSLMLVPLLGRISILLLMLSSPYISPQGLAKKILQNLPSEEARWVVVMSLAFAGLFLGWANVILVVLLVLWIRSAAIDRLGGVTSDIFGVTVELAETAALLAAVLL